MGGKGLSIRGAVLGASRVTSCMPGVSPATCRAKFGHVLVAVGYSTLNGTDFSMVRKIVAEMSTQLSDMCPRRSVVT